MLLVLEAPKDIEKMEASFTKGSAFVGQYSGKIVAAAHEPRLALCAGRFGVPRGLTIESV